MRPHRCAILATAWEFLVRAFITPLATSGRSSLPPWSVTSITPHGHGSSDLKDSCAEKSRASFHRGNHRTFAERSGKARLLPDQLGTRSGSARPASWGRSLQIAWAKSKHSSAVRSRQLKPMALFHPIAAQAIWPGCCSACCSAFVSLPVRSRSGPCSKASRALHSLCSTSRIDKNTGETNNAVY